MKYPICSPNSSRVYTMPPLCGGLNRMQPPAAIDPSQLSDAENLWWQMGALRTRKGLCVAPGGRCTAVAPLSAIRKLHKLGSRALVSEYQSTDPYGFCLWELKEDGQLEKLVQISGINALYFSSFLPVQVLPESHLSGAQFLLYATMGKVFGVCPGSSTPLVDLTNSCYVPLYRTNCAPLTSKYGPVLNGTAFEEPNLLTDQVRVSFTTDQTGMFYFLPSKGIAGEIKLKISTALGSTMFATIPANETVASVPYSPVGSVRINRYAGYLAFMNADGMTIAFPSDGVRNDLEVTYHLPNAQTVNFSACRLHTYFGGNRSRLGGGTRLFVAGDPTAPNLVRWSSVQNPLYFPVYNKYRIGQAAPITAMAQQGRQLIFFQEHAIYAADSAAGDTLTADSLENGDAAGVETGAGYFPVTHLHADIGCDEPDSVQMCNNHLVFVHRGSVYGLYGTSNINQTDVRLLSASLGDAGIGGQGSCFGAVESGYYLLVCGDVCHALWLSSPGFSTGDLSGQAAGESRLAWFDWKLPAAPDGIWSGPVGAVFWLTLPYVSGGAVHADQPPQLAMLRLTGDADDLLNHGASNGVIKKAVCARFSTATLALGDVVRLAGVHRIELLVGAQGGSVSVSVKTERERFAPPAVSLPVQAENQVVAVRPGVFRSRLLELTAVFSHPVVVQGVRLFYTERNR